MPSKEHIRYQVKRPYILWLGPVVDEATMMSSPAVSPAANRWQYGLIRTLQSLGLRVIVIGHIPEPVWPKGRFRIGPTGAGLAAGIEGQIVSYWNLPCVCSLKLSQEYLKAFRRLCHSQGMPIAVVSYNARPWAVAVGLYAQEDLGIPWVCIVADAPESASRKERFDAVISEATGRVFLPWGSFRDAQQNPKFHLDGGVERLHFVANEATLRQDGSKSIVLYAGAMSRWGGVSFLVEGFRRVEKEKVELWICGRGANRDVQSAAIADSRIKFLGFVPEERLREALQKATVFVNPRPSSIPENRYNFPSKVLEYLSYGKPVISTWTDGLSPEYRNVLVILEEENPDCLARTIEEVLGWNREKRQKMAKQIELFLGTRRLWPVQARNFYQWLLEEVVS